MERVKKIFVQVHVVLWTLFILLASLQLSNEGDHWPTLTTGFILTCLLVFYGNFYLLTTYPGKKKRGDYYRRLIAIVLIGPLPFLYLHPRAMEVWQDFFQYYIMTLVTIVPLFTFLGWLARVTENLVLNTIKKEQLEKQAVESELHYLKSQINPHFLFNTLNNIHTLVYKQASTAPEAVLRLSSLMRYMIYESNAATVPLSREMHYLQDYVGLQQLRYKSSPVVDLEVEGDIASCHIAPLLFIHLLENAYKHSPARLEPGAIKVRVEIKENTLTFRIQNPAGNKAGNALEEPGGIGLPNVRKRLALLYPEKHSLEIDNLGEIFIVTLKIHDLHTQAHEREAQLLYN
ncbi:sensor histidine kinase [Pontibacter lucknowensis]|uniref:Histidine kinase n=1 Tax=Pontibacter lucknowensis TaxID=1077936 RepID=A0A1N6X9L6_9BACT|nr:histidine kinase [Pontibacter lucknowensis]EJF09730.1 signal transduction histidine kinase LytS [Pontibacter sp. BAB1700]SIQ99032.1 Histidine kinase [Pontibacter lucknowensis]